MPRAPLSSPSSLFHSPHSSIPLTRITLPPQFSCPVRPPSSRPSIPACVFAPPLPRLCRQPSSANRRRPRSPSSHQALSRSLSGCEAKKIGRHGALNDAFPFSLSLCCRPSALSPSPHADGLSSPLHRPLPPLTHIGTSPFPFSSCRLLPDLAVLHLEGSGWAVIWTIRSLARRRPNLAGGCLSDPVSICRSLLHASPIWPFFARRTFLLLARGRWHEGRRRGDQIGGPRGRWTGQRCGDRGRISGTAGPSGSVGCQPERRCIAFGFSSVSASLAIVWRVSDYQRWPVVALCDACRCPSCFHHRRCCRVLPCRAATNLAMVLDAVLHPIWGYMQISTPLPVTVEHSNFLLFSWE